MGEWLSLASLLFNVILTLGAAIGGFFLRNALRATKTDSTIDDVIASIKTLQDGFRHLDEAIRGNGKIGLCEQTRNLDRRVDEMDRRIIRLEESK
ncbi:MAG TPA: hypothetical protein PLE60_15285 [Candidatus Latescibacteria bacterium]|nr:hypothetical protein [Candidatus Latescibacterota bacterium]